MSPHLVVAADDDPAVLTLIAAVLRSFRVKTFSSPDSAARFLGTLTSSPSLLISDMVMPRMNGPDLALAFQRRFPRMSVLLISGYTSDLLYDMPGSWRFLMKPFTPGQLKAVVEDLLGS